MEGVESDRYHRISRSFSSRSSSRIRSRSSRICGGGVTIILRKFFYAYSSMTELKMAYQVDQLDDLPVVAAVSKVCEHPGRLLLDLELVCLHGSVRGKGCENDSEG